MSEAKATKRKAAVRVKLPREARINLPFQPAHCWASVQNGQPTGIAWFAEQAKELEASERAMLIPELLYRKLLAAGRRK